VVTLVRKVVGPEEPKIAWLDVPPNEEPMLAPFPAWRSTVIIRTTLTVI
jgi:hypothetical protein